VVAERTELTIEGLIRKFDRIHELAITERQLSAANGALTAVAKLAGLWVEKSDNTNTFRNADPDSLTDEQLAYIAKQGLADDPEETRGSGKSH
jgi:predicted DNA binding protein